VRSGGARRTLRARIGSKLRYWYTIDPDPIKDRWSEATEGVAIPSGAVLRFLDEHPEVRAKDVAHVEKALLQWVRIEGRTPESHELPSLAVERLWAALRVDHADWSRFCSALVVQLPERLDEQTRWVLDEDSDQMRATFSDGIDDERPFVDIPILFLVDARIGIKARDRLEPASSEDDSSPEEPPPLQPPEPILRPAPATVASVADRGSAQHRVWSRVRHFGRPAPTGLQDGWYVVMERATVPAGALARFNRENPEVAPEHIPLVRDGLLQWLRIEGRAYPTRHPLPSRAVDALWRAVRADDADWARFRDSFQADLDHVLDRGPVMWDPATDPGILHVTWSDSFNEEPPRSRTPLLFRVDEAVGILRGLHYQGYCAAGEPPGERICLHLPVYSDPPGTSGP
jgi:hypothetical protein